MFSLFYCNSLRLTFTCHLTEPQFYRLEGVWLTESGMSLLRSISMSPLHKRRQRRSRLGTLCCEGGPDGMDLREVEGEGEEGKGWHTCPSFIGEQFLGVFATFNIILYKQAVGIPWNVNPRWSNQGALTEKVVLMEALTAWLTVTVLKVEQRRQRTAKKESENLTGLVNDPKHTITT